MKTLEDLKLKWLEFSKGMNTEGAYRILFNVIVEDLRNAAREHIPSKNDNIDEWIKNFFNLEVDK